MFGDGLAGEKEPGQLHDRLRVVAFAPQRFDDDRAEDGSSELLDGGVGGELAIADAAADALAQVLLDAEALSEVRSDTGVLGRRGDERSQQHPALRRLEDRQHAAQPGLDVGDEVSRVGDVEVDGDQPTLGEALADQRAARRPPPVDGLLADAGLLRDPLDRESVVALIVEQPGRGVEDGLACRCAAHGPAPMIVHHKFRITTEH